MNGVRSTYMRKGYLLTALAAAVLLAASPGIASAQSIGFVGDSGMVSETASMEAGALESPHKITVRASGFSATQRPTTVAVNNSADISLVIQSATGRTLLALDDVAANANTDITSHFANLDEVVLVVAQDNNAASTQDGSTDDNWLDERITFTLTAAAGTDISENLYTLTVDDSHVAPVAQFMAPSFTLTEGSERDVSLDIVSGTTGRADATIPPAALANAGNTGNVIVRVSNHSMVTIDAAGTMCPPASPPGQRRAVHIALGAAWGGTVDQAAFDRTARLATVATATGGSIETLADTANSADMKIITCGVAGFRDQQVTLTILPNNLVEQPGARVRGDFAIGSPLTVTVDSDEAAPTLSFSPTDVTIDEGGSTSTRLIADGASATEVGMVKLAVEGDAMVSLMHEDTMLEEMDGYVMVNMGTSNSVRLTAMSHSDRDLMDGETKYKAWKLMEGSSDAMIGDDYWFRVDVMGSTAVPALPLVGQLLLALFLMAGGSRLYRRRQG